MRFRAPQGHLHCGSLHLMQTPEMHQRIEKTRQASRVLEKLPSVSLDWGRRGNSKKQTKEEAGMQAEKRRKTSVPNLVQNHLSLPDYNPARLLDMLHEVMQVPNDNQLAAALELERPIICRLRHRRASLSPGVLLRMHDVSGLPINNLRELAGIPVPTYE